MNIMADMGEGQPLNPEQQARFDTIMARRQNEGVPTGTISDEDKKNSD